MILILSPKATPADIEQLMLRLEWMGLRVSKGSDEERACLAVVGAGDESVRFEEFTALPFVDEVLPFKRPYKLAGRELRPHRTVIDVGGVSIGGGDLAVMAGPCSIESESQIHLAAKQVADAGANILRGGAFKPRTSPYAFQGLGEEGLRYMAEAAKEHGLLTVSEVMDTENVEMIASYVDIFQVGARNMQNYSLLKRLGQMEKPVLLKRGLSATYQDLLMAAEYILAGGNERVLLCERGIRTFEPYTRNTLDVAAVPILHELSHLPVIVDPSHGTGLRRFVTPMARAGVAAGADGIMVEVHPQPDTALSDAQQTLSPMEFGDLMESLRVIGPAAGIRIPDRRDQGGRASCLGQNKAAAT